MAFSSSKTYGHEVGLSSCFRQHRANSHCRLLHGYALSVHLEFEAEECDSNNWVVDFGALKSVKEWLQEQFDHKLIVAADDPKLEILQEIANAGLAEIVILDNVGCEAFANHVGTYVERWLVENDYTPRVSLTKVTIREHGANSASWAPDTAVASVYDMSADMNRKGGA